MIQTILIEDEKPAARFLGRLLEKQQITPLTQLHSVKEAINWLKNNPSPDLIFLDIQLGDGISFEIFEQVKVDSAIIFTTAYDEYAIKAFDLNAISYLLKPIRETELVKALDKYNQQKAKINWQNIDFDKLLKNNFENTYKERFLLKIASKLKTVESKDIACFYSANKATYIFTENRTYPIDQTLQELEMQLDPKYFFRSGRNAIVNLKFIESIEAYSGNRYKIFIPKLEEEIIVSREKVTDFKNWLEN